MNKTTLFFLSILAFINPNAYGMHAHKVRALSRVISHARFCAMSHTSDTSTDFPKIIFKPCEDEEMDKKLLENRELIEAILSKFKEIDTVTVGISDSGRSSHFMWDHGIDDNGTFYANNYIYLGLDWFQEDNNEKQFIVAHEAAHIACLHHNHKGITKFAYKHCRRLTSSVNNLFNICLASNLPIPALIFYSAIYCDYPVNWGYFLCGEMCIAAIYITSIVGLSALHFSLKPSREQEKEADLMAAEKLQTAQGGIKWVEKFLHDLRWFEPIVSTHPSLKKRLAYLKEWEAKNKKAQSERE